MKEIFENLEAVIKDMGLTIIEKHEDDFCIAVAVQHSQKGVFVVYTTQTNIGLDDFYAFNMFRTIKHIPFDTIVCNDSRSFISQYSEALKSSNMLKSTYSSRFCPEEFRFFVNCAG